MTTVNPKDICQLEFLVNDLERATKFYEQVMGWSASPAALHDFVILEVPEDCPFGISLVPQKKSREQNPECRMIPYFKTKDADAIVKKAEANGGKLRFGPKQAGGGIVFYQIEDPDGQRLGLVQAL